MKKIELGNKKMPQFTILIVDDVPKNLQYLGNTLKDENYKFEFATNGIKALEWIKKKSFDLILLDIMMPEMDGFEVCEKIRKDNRYKDVPIIFLTAYTDQKNILKGFGLGAQDYVTKPFNTKELLARVKTHLELKNSKEQLKLMNRWLEEKVKERTMQLQKANEDLLSLEKCKAEFLNLISHEIRTPLNGVIGPLHLLKDELKGGNLTDLINILDISVARLEKFAYTAMRITELRTIQHQFKFSAIQLKLIIEDTIKVHSKRCDQKKLQMSVDEIPDDYTIFGEFELVKQVFAIILDNSIKYSEQNGKIFIKIQHSNTKVLCQIIDQGKGFSKKALENLYIYFSPGDENLDQTLGLDLALAKLIMDVHSGKIEAGNMESGGAVVTLTFFRNV